MVELLERQAVLGSQVARIRLVPAGVDHPRWGEVVVFVGRLGVVLDPWQLEVLRVSLMRTVDLSRWAAFAVAVCAPRQNGKNGITEIRELVGAALLGEKLVVHTAHLADTSKEAFRRLEDLIDENSWLKAQVKHIWRTNGHEQIEFRNGCRIRFRTRTRGGGRGLSGSPVIFDEAMFLPEVSMGSILPVISAQPDPQVWYMGSAVDQVIHEDGVSFARVRARAIEGSDPRLAYFEWSMDAETPDLVEDEMLDDLMELAKANPAFGRRISAEYLEAERRELDRRTYAVERGCVGDWPALDGGKGVFDLKVWDGLADAGSMMEGPITLAFDVEPNRRFGSIAAAGLRADGSAHVELIERRPGTDWIPARIGELTVRHTPAAVVCDERGPASSLIPEIEPYFVPLMQINGSDFARACGRFFDGVVQLTVRHLGQKELRDAVRGAAQRPLGEAWAWSRRNSEVDISPLVACTLALYGLTTNRPAEVWASSW